MATHKGTVSLGLARRFRGLADYRRGRERGGAQADTELEEPRDLQHLKAAGDCAP